MSDWRPIETAPMDLGVLVIDESRDVVVATQVRPGKWRDRNDEVVWRPSHWMPLPEVPR